MKSGFSSALARILIIDDDPDLLALFKLYLGQSQYALSFAQSGEEALEQLAEYEFALVILDVQLPGMDGFEVARRIQTRSATRDLPILFMTGYSPEDPIFFKEYETGAFDVLFKPLHWGILRGKIEVFLTLHQQQQQLKAQSQELQELLAIQTELSDNLIQSAIDLQDSHEKLKISSQQLEISYSELERVSRTFQAFVPRQFIDRILSSSFELGFFQEETMAVLFLDIRSYTKHVEQMPPEENMAFLNAFFHLLEPFILQHRGFIDKFIGDAVMTLFDQPHASENAVKSAIAMQQEVARWNQQRQQEGKPPIHFGVGINTGNVMVGVVGTPHRMNSTVIGDHVNLAARIEELTKKYQTQILISQHTYAEINPQDYLIREIDTLRVRGKSTSTTIYEVFDANPLEIRTKKLETLELLQRGIQLYQQQQFEEAISYFRQCLRIYPQDIVPLYYIKRCYYLRHHTGKPWAEPALWSERMGHSESERREPRYPLHTPTNFYLDENAPHLAGEIENVSRQGLKLLTGHPLDLGEIFTAHLFFNKASLEHFLKQSPHSLLCRVVWRKQSRTEEHHQAYWEIGAEIVVIDQDDESRFQQALERLIRRENME